jgi:hypothetical protein
VAITRPPNSIWTNASGHDELKSSVTPGGWPASNDAAGEISNELTESQAHKRLRVDPQWTKPEAKLARFAPTREGEKDENPQSFR